MGDDGKWVVKADRKATGVSKVITPPPQHKPAIAAAVPDAEAADQSTPDADDVQLSDEELKVDLDAPAVVRIDGLVERRILLNDAKEAKERALREDSRRRERWRTVRQLVIFIVLFVGAVRLVMGPQWLETIESTITSLTGPERGEPASFATPSPAPDKAHGPQPKGIPPPKAPEGM